MDINKPTDIEWLGDPSLSTHFCLFYETEQDLIETLALYFNTGLAEHEFCLWITPESFEEARDTLRQAIPSADQHLQAGNIEILPNEQCYYESDIFEAKSVIERFEQKLGQALEKGYARMRILADEAWLTQEYWKAFSDYERHLDERLGNKPMSILCAYPTHAHNATDILDIARTYRFIVAKRNETWEILEFSKSDHASAETDMRTIEKENSEALKGREPSLILRYGLPILAVSISLVAPFLWRPYVFRTSLFFLSILISTWIGGIGPGLLAVLLSAFASNVLLSQTGVVDAHFQYIPNIISFLITALLVGSWSETRKRAEYALHEARDQLEKKVGERTAGLSRANQALEAEIRERKRTEEALRTDEYRLQAAIDAADILLWEHDLLSGHLTWLGHSDRVLGFTPGAFDGTLVSFEKLVHPEDIEELRQVRQRALEERTEYGHEYRIIWPDGSIHWITAQGRFIYNEAGKPLRLYGALLDITQRKLAEVELERNREILQTIFNNVPAMITMVDQNGRFILTNRDFESRLGWHPDELSQQSMDMLTELYPDPQMRQAVLDSVERANGRWEDFKTRAKDGRVIDTSWAIVRLSDGSIIGVGKDITERKRMEEDLRKAELLYRTLVENVPPIIYLSGLDQHIGVMYISPRIRTLGFTQEEWLADPELWFRQIHPEDQQRVLDGIKEGKKTGGVIKLEYRIQARDGSIHWFLDEAAEVTDENGNFVFRQGIMLDITEPKQADQQIRQYAARMEALAEISRTFTEAGLDSQSVLDAVARCAAELIGDMCIISLYSEDRQRVSHIAFHHLDPKILSFLGESLSGMQQRVIDREAYHRLLDGESEFMPVVDQNAYRARLQSEFRPYFDAVGISSLLSVPLNVRGRVIGSLSITRDRRGEPYTYDDQVLLEHIADRAALTIQNAKLFEQVEGARERLKALSRRLLEVQEFERRALTAELHDRVGQNLTGLSINLLNMKASLSPEEAQALEAKFDDAQALVEDTSRQIRNIMAELHLPELEDYGLAAALETYAERAVARANLELIANLPDLEPPRLPSDVRATLFRAAQEAIVNVLKHANATQLRVSLEEGDGKVRLKIEDNGQGFKVDRISQSEARTWGLQIMRERIESIGGNLQIESEPGQGTRVTFEIGRTS